MFHALADPTRRAMLRDLADRDQSVGDLARPHDMSLAAASKHVKVLERAGLLSRQVRGRTHTCRLRAEPLRGAGEWLAHYQRFWIERLDALDAMIEVEDPNDGRTQR